MVQTTNVSHGQLADVKMKHGVPKRLHSCHTGVVDNYVIEGHVPAAVISRLLSERPEVTGLGVPGMPIGSPGMEGPSPKPYRVFSFDRDGRMEVYERIHPNE